MMRWTLLLSAALLLNACGEEFLDPETAEEIDVSAGGKADFTWGSGAAGQSSTTVQFAKNKILTLGTIPVGKKDVLVQLDTTVDVDLQLLDLNGTKVVYKSSGMLYGPGKSQVSYKGITVEWSGYNGTVAGKGNEYVKLTGTTTSSFKVRIFTLAAGSATVKLSWGAAGGGTSSGFEQRLAAFKSKYASAVRVTTRAGKPAIFLSTSQATDETQARALLVDLRAMIGTHTIMVWNPAGENFFHLGLPDNPKLDPMYRNKSFTAYDHLRIWDSTLGNFDEYYSGDEEEEEEGIGDGNTYLYDEPSFDEYQLAAERAVALFVLTDAQLALLNDYLNAIKEDFRGTLGETEYNGGTPPYFSGDSGSTHNCTSWFTAFLHHKVSSAISTHASPASMMQDYTGGWGSTDPEYRAMLVFNYGKALPADGSTLPSGFPFDFGH